jgi:hypothetical protein
MFYLRKLSVGGGGGGARGSAVVKAQCYKIESRGVDTQ